MSEFRQDPVTGHCVIVAMDRAKRPHAFVDNPPALDELSCPFCIGQETETPAPIAVYGSSTAAEPWSIRVVPNKYPAVLSNSPPASPLAQTQSANGHGFFHCEAAIGSHEVIIESPRHVISISELEEPIVTLLFRVYQDRLRDLRAAGELAYAMAFKNVRPAAGASVAHSHSQLLATPFVPPRVQLELNHSRLYYQEHRRCVFCDLMESEAVARTRVVAETENFLAWCPFASRCPYELWIAPRRHTSHYETADGAHLDEVALLVRNLVARIELTHPNAAYNYLLHTSPFDTSELAHYHWHIELLPQLIKFAGFEWGSGCYVNPVPPELAAARLRAVSP